MTTESVEPMTVDKARGILKANRSWIGWDKEMDLPEWGDNDSISLDGDFTPSELEALLFLRPERAYEQPNRLTNTTDQTLDSILEGIDKDEGESEEGWWETSTGASFGKGKLAEIKAFFATLEQRVPLSEDQLQRVAKRVEAGCDSWIGIGARDVEQVLKEVAVS